MENRISTFQRRWTLTSYPEQKLTQNRSKVQIYLKAKTIKFLEENIRIRLQDLDLSNTFMIPKGKKQKKKKIDEMDFIKIKTLYIKGYYQESNTQ